MGKDNSGWMEWIRPIIVSVAIFILGSIINNLFVVGSLEGIPGDFSSVETESGYKISCNFRLKNSGILKLKSEKIQLNIPKHAKIDEIDIPRKHKHLYQIVAGGSNHNFVILLIEGIKGRQTIEGSVVFSQNKKWGKDNINPLFFS